MEVALSQDLQREYFTSDRTPYGNAYSKQAELLCGRQRLYSQPATM